MVKLSVIVASCGRASLANACESIVTQLHPGDELLVSVNNDAPWGHAARNRMMPQASGDALCFMDDDDRYLPGAFNVIHAALEAAPNRVHIFRMRFVDGQHIWIDQKLTLGNVSTQMFVVPNVPEKLGQWTNVYEGDFEFLVSTVGKQDEPVFHEDIIALYRATD